MKSPYRHADKALRTLKEAVGREFQNLSVSLPFDELNLPRVREQVNETFARVNARVRKAYRGIARNAKKDTEKELGILPVRLGSAVLVASVLRRYDPVTRYVYTAEWGRKRDRLVEGIMAGGGRRDVREAIRRTVTVILPQIIQYADNVTDEVRVRVFDEAGIDLVMWNTQRDGKVCKECQDRDLQIFSIDNLPPKHYHCRCYLTGVMQP